MELFNNLLLIETEKQAHREILYTIRSINSVYKEWKKRGKNRRKNAVSLHSTSVNKIASMSPESIDYVNSEIKGKLSIIIMRCLSLPVWQPIKSKQSTYKKLYPYLKKLENTNPNTGTKANVREIIMTRFSAAFSVQSRYPQVFVGYEPVIPNQYLRFLFGEEKLPEKTYRMESLPLPEDFDELINTIRVNHDKAVDLYLKTKGKNNV